VGERLWRQAASRVYGRNLVESGPDFVDLQLGNGQAQGQAAITFANAQGLKTTDSAPVEGFIIAGADKVFRKANAQIQGSKILLSHPDIKAPKAVRYAWANNPIANLTNSENLPAVPFRTDDWLEGDVSAK